MNGNKGQAGMGMIFELIMLVLVILILTAFMPVIQDSLDTQRNYDVLNCKSTTMVCDPALTQDWCYNDTLDTETTTCLILDIFLPFIVIAILIGGVGLVLVGRGSGAPQQPAYGY